MRHIESTKKRRRGWSRAPLAALTAVTLLGCGDNILEVVDPDLVTPESINQAELYWAGVIGDFMGAATGQTSVATYVGLFTDEFQLSGTFPTRIEVDERNISDTNGTVDNVFESLHHARNGAANAADLLAEEFGADSRIGEMNNLEGYTYVLLGEVYCSGVPFGRTPVNGDQTQGQPLTTTQMFEGAVERFDQAIANADGSSTQTNLARVGKARALLNLGQYDAAASEVSSIADDWVYLIRHDENATGGESGIYERNHDDGRWTLSDNEGENGIFFRSAMDPRLPWEEDDEPGFDAATPLYLQLIWTDDNDDVAFASGLEARLIEAEAMLQNDPGGWLAALNDLRADVDGLEPLADPGNQDARVRMHFEERAYWLFGTGHRLGDLRRMVRQYGFAEDEVFPTGQHFKGSAYGDQMNFPIPQDETNNPNFEQCLDTAA